MPRQTGSKVVPCPKCEAKVNGMPSDRVTCKTCGKKFVISKKMLAALGKK